MTNPDDLASTFTKREYLAMQAMTASYFFWSKHEAGSGTVDPKILAKTCIDYADALIKQLNKKVA